MSAAVALRRVPYPYRAMLAVTNDIDEAGWDDFARLHDFMNGDARTPLGAGLDLEIADSFFFYGTESPAKTPTFAYFGGCNPDRPEPWAREMRELIERGWLDSLHSWGDFSRTGGFTRDLAARASAVLRGLGNPVSVWINHGDALNEQAAGRPGWDDGRAPHGHADITLACGLRYFWTGSLTSVIGQDAEETLADRLSPARIIEEVVRPLKRAAGTGPAIVSFFANALMKPADVAGTTIDVFQRYGFWDKPAAPDLGAVLSAPMLDRLEQRGGFASIYTHLFRRPAGMPIDRVDWSPLARLARRHHGGGIQVTTTARMLGYAKMRQSIAWTVEETADGTGISVRDAGSARLDGLTFYVPDARRAFISVNGERATVERNEPDHTGRPSVSLPWPRLRYRPIAPGAALAAGAPA